MQEIGNMVGQMKFKATVDSLCNLNESIYFG